MKKFNFNSKRANIILVIGIFVVVTIVSIVNNGSSNAGQFSLNDKTLVLSGPENYSMTIQLDDMETIEVIEEFDKGSAVEGGTKNSYSYGTWSCERFPVYDIVALTKVNTVIAATGNDGEVYVFNLENAQTTRLFYNSLMEDVLDEPESTIAAD